MLSMSSSIFPNKEHVASKIMDGELIIINLTTGVYYSMDNVGTAIWEMIEEGFNIDEGVAAIIERYDVSPDRVLADVKRIAEELLKENLIYMSDQAERAKKKTQSTNHRKLPYVPPKLNIYRDMEDLLALDPPAFGLEETPWKEPNDNESQNK